MTNIDWAIGVLRQIMEDQGRQLQEKDQKINELRMELTLQKDERGKDR